MPSDSLEDEGKAKDDERRRLKKDKLPRKSDLEIPLGAGKDSLLFFSDMKNNPRNDSGNENNNQETVQDKTVIL